MSDSMLLVVSTEHSLDGGDRVEVGDWATLREVVRCGRLDGGLEELGGDTETVGAVEMTGADFFDFFLPRQPRVLLVTRPSFTDRLASAMVERPAIGLEL